MYFATCLSGLIDPKSELKKVSIIGITPKGWICGTATVKENQSPCYWLYDPSTQRTDCALNFEISCFSPDGNLVGRTIDSIGDTQYYCEFSEGKFLQTWGLENLLKAEKTLKIGYLTPTIVRQNKIYGDASTNKNQRNIPWYWTNTNGIRKLATMGEFGTLVQFMDGDGRLWGLTKQDPKIASTELLIGPSIIYWDDQGGDYTPDEITRFNSNEAVFPSICYVNAQQLLVHFRYSDKMLIKEGIALLDTRTGSPEKSTPIPNNMRISKILATGNNGDCILEMHFIGHPESPTSYFWEARGGFFQPLSAKIDGIVQGMNRNQINTARGLDIGPNGEILLTCEGSRRREEAWLLTPQSN